MTTAISTAKGCIAISARRFRAGLAAPPLLRQAMRGVAAPERHEVARALSARPNWLAREGIGRVSARKGRDEQIISSLSCKKVAP
jgi:hypothetical protein